MNRYDPLVASARVFRLADRGGRFLPTDAVIPLPDWFEPTTEDKAEAARTARQPGVSVWDSSRTATTDARRMTAKPLGEAFCGGVGAVRALGIAAGRELDVVWDPRPAEEGEGASGHALIEGLKRPDGLARTVHKDLLRQMANLFAHSHTDLHAVCHSGPFRHVHTVWKAAARDDEPREVYLELDAEARVVRILTIQVSGAFRWHSDGDEHPVWQEGEIVFDEHDTRNSPELDFREISIQEFENVWALRVR